MPDQAKSNVRPRLGRGLSSLINSSIGSAEQPKPQAVTHSVTSTYIPVSAGAIIASATAAPDKTGSPLEVPVDKISPNPYQPRREFKAEDLRDLSKSIAQQGILQPLVVCHSSDGDHNYVLIAGERRLRAAKQAGLAKVPCVVRQASPQQMLEWALIENIQRADLNAMERAQAYQQHMDRFAISSAQLAERLGEPRTTVANYLRLLELCDDLQKMLKEGALSFGHAKVLAGLTGAPQRQIELARRVATESLSVRQLEVLAAQAPAEPANASVKPARPKAAYVSDLEEQLTRSLGTHVRIIPGRAKYTGRVVVEYYSLDDFESLCSRMGVAVER